MRRPKPRKAPLLDRIDLNPEISHGLMSVFLFIVSGLSILSIFNLAGVAGEFINALLALTFGQVRYLFPILMLIVAILTIKDLDYDYRPTHLIGAVLFLLSFNGLIHLQRPTVAMANYALQGYGGGLAGLALAWPLSTYVNYWGGMVILIGLLFASLIFLFNTSLAQLVALHKKLFLGLGWLGKMLVTFFGAFKLNNGIKIKGAYNNNAKETEVLNYRSTAPELNEDDAPRFERKAIKKDDEADEESSEAEPKEKEEESIIVKKPRQVKPLPPLSLLTSNKSKPTSGDIVQNAEIIKNTLHHFGIEVEMADVRVGPTVTQYAFKPAQGVKLTRITTLSNDLALALAAHPIRIEAPIPGKALVGVEVPNQKVALVTLKELLESPEFKTRKHSLEVAIGKDVAGKVWFADLPKMPHLLIAGATNSGKTVCINTVLLSLLFQNTPETLRLIMIDPKRVELTLYNGIPHLLTPVITDAAKTINALKWTIGEMERRFTVLSEVGKRDIASYNVTATDPLPHIVFVIDELADLMASSPAEVEAGIIRLAQMARAVGIHLVVATQRPSVEVITGLMKANIPARIAFSVASVIDSRTILDCPGAEKLLGRGDMLFLTAEMSKPKRLQGAYVSEEEIKNLVEYLRGDEPPEYDEAVIGKGGGAAGTLNMFGGPSDDQDPIFEDAKRCIIESGKASASLLQRRLKIGYARAARILDELEEAGIVGPADGAKPREVFTEHIADGFSEAAEKKLNLAAAQGITRPKPEPGIEPEEQTLDAGGAVFDEPKEDVEPDKEVEEQTDEKTTNENNPI